MRVLSKGPNVIYIVITALLRDLSSSSRVEVELEGLVGLNGYREGMLTG